MSDITLWGQIQITMCTKTKTKRLFYPNFAPQKTIIE
jgi:hypothetical protein